MGKGIEVLDSNMELAADNLLRAVIARLIEEDPQKVIEICVHANDAMRKMIKEIEDLKNDR